MSSLRSSVDSSGVFIYPHGMFAASLRPSIKTMMEWGAGSSGKDASYQILWPESDSWTPQLEGKKLTSQIVLWPPHGYHGILVHACMWECTYQRINYKNKQPTRWNLAYLYHFNRQPAHHETESFLKLGPGTLTHGEKFRGVHGCGRE